MRTRLVTAAIVLLLAGCTATEPAPTPTVVATEMTTGDHAMDAAGLRTAGAALTSGDLTLSYTVMSGTSTLFPTEDDDGAVTMQLDPSVPGDTILLAPPEGDTAEALSDGGVLIRDAAGAAVGGITSTGLDVTVESDGLIAYQPVTAPTTATLTLATVAVRSAEWRDIDDEGGRSLAVVPSTWARGGGLAVDALLWAQLVTVQPEADSQTMHDQLTCHQVGAPDKESWNLEPWRPDVGLVQTMLARCNPE